MSISIILFMAVRERPPAKDLRRQHSVVCLDIFAGDYKI